MNEGTTNTNTGGQHGNNDLVVECQIYAKKLKDVVDAKAITQEQYDDIAGCRVSITNTLCYLLFGDKFDEICKGYLAFITDFAKRNPLEK